MVVGVGDYSSCPYAGGRTGPVQWNVEPGPDPQRSLSYDCHERSAGFHDVLYTWLKLLVYGVRHSFLNALRMLEDAVGAAALSHADPRHARPFGKA